MLTLQEIQHKNYCFAETLIREIEKYEVVSFDLFDTLLLREVLFPADIFRLLSGEITECGATHDFHFIRSNLENEIRSHSGLEDITLDDIYHEMQLRYPEWPVQRLKQRELELELEYCRVNPLLKTLYDAAVSLKKTIWIISDMYLPVSFLEQLLRKNGYECYQHLYVSGQLGKCKSTGSLYRHILGETGRRPEQWLHIGDNGHSDAAVPRQFGITAAMYHCPRERFFQERAAAHHREEESAGHPIAEIPLDDSIVFSRKTALEINQIYTQSASLKTGPVIHVDHVSMMFNMSSEKVDNIKEYIIRLLKRQLMFQEFWALRDISFSVCRGEKVGLVGLNGSGKSTMLKIVSGVMKPTKGRVTVSGSIAPLIELGAGFDYELSARENVYLNGAILGHSREEMDVCYQEIIDFAELREFQDIAIKNFSSGMIARLGFAIATCHVPDILIIDEILSVGDFSFQQKCHRKMEQLTGKGATVLFVSHSSGDIVAMCDRAIWLDHGTIVAEGEAQYIVEKYLSS